jgi:hypothetical protein
VEVRTKKGWEAAIAGLQNWTIAGPHLSVSVVEPEPDPDLEPEPNPDLELNPDPDQFVSEIIYFSGVRFKTKHTVITDADLAPDFAPDSKLM